MSLAAVAFSLFAASAGPSRGDGLSRDKQIDALEKQVQDLKRQLGEGQKENPKATPASGPRPKHSVINLAYVIVNYKQFTKFKSEYQQKLESYDSHLQKLKDEYERYEKEARKTTDQEQKEKLAKQMLELRNQMSDQSEDAKKVLAAMETKHLAGIYKDVQTAAERYAKAHEIEMVSHFNDGTTDADAAKPDSINRKMSQGGLFPLYVAPGLDISKEVVAVLNGEKDGEQETPRGEE
jgi:Skp family chaperone for outer membrane proteins